MKPGLTLSAAERWRLLLGEAAQQPLGSALAESSDQTLAMDQALAWLYGRQESGQGSDSDTLEGCFRLIVRSKTIPVES